jgi:hypothetical protein
MGASIRMLINALLERHKVERAQTAPINENMPEIISEWNYRPKKSGRRHAGADHG